MAITSWDAETPTPAAAYGQPADGVLNPSTPIQTGLT
jgi:hypothetical protein